MGVKYFYKWLCKTIPSCSSTFISNVDAILIDANALFHNVAQRVYKYGHYKPLPRLIPRKIPIKQTLLDPEKLEDELCKQICNEIDMLIKTLNPNKRVIICTDGVCPISKQNQQRLRRYKSVMEKDKTFDSNSLSTGTKLMDKISKAIHTYIKNVLCKTNLEIIFSSEKVPGEGEGKLINYIRKYHTTEKLCIVSLDADLIMLLLTTFHNNLFIMRLMPGMDDAYVDINNVKEGLLTLLTGNKEDELKDNEMKNIILDFVVLCFLIGNDFLPTIPTMEIMNGSIDNIISQYVLFGKRLVNIDQDNCVVLNSDNLEYFITTIAQDEEKFMNLKISQKAEYFKDELLEKHTMENDIIDFDSYKTDYYTSHFGKDVNISQIVDQYLCGMVWNINYYSIGVTDWSWCYPYHYGPFLCDMAKHIKHFKPKFNKNTKPNTSFIQLLSILPPQSHNLLPKGLENISIETKFGCEDVKLDYSGKRHDWEAIVILPFIDQTSVELLYNSYKDKISQVDMLRNVVNNPLVYNKNEIKIFTM